MKTNALLVLAAGLLLVACGETSEPKSVQKDETPDEPTVALSSHGTSEDGTDQGEGLTDEENAHDFGAGLKFMREEEKLARDVYITLGEEFGLQIFRNIQESEETHTTAVYDLLDKYDIPDPAYMTDVGEFTNPDLQRIYDELVDRGMRGETHALLVGAYIEEHDILDLDERLESDDLPDDVRQTYTSLRAGSTNHLKAFVSNLERSGTSYSPQLMDVDAYEVALN